MTDCLLHLIIVDKDVALMTAKGNKYYQPACGVNALFLEMHEECSAYPKTASSKIQY